jgi:hypothetical protein
VLRVSLFYLNSTLNKALADSIAETIFIVNDCIEVCNACTQIKTALGLLLTSIEIKENTSFIQEEILFEIPSAVLTDTYVLEAAMRVDETTEDSQIKEKMKRGADYKEYLNAEFKKIVGRGEAELEESLPQEVLVANHTEEFDYIFLEPKERAAFIEIEESEEKGIDKIQIEKEEDYTYQYDMEKGRNPQENVRNFFHQLLQRKSKQTGVSYIDFIKPRTGHSFYPGDV